MNEDRVLALSGVHNFRDYGGYALPGGGRLKRGVLWRSGDHSDASEDDLAAIGALGLASVFDLRTSHERTRYPSRRPAGFAAQEHLADVAGTAPAPHLAAARSGGRGSIDAAREGMRRAYTTIPFRPELLAILQSFLAGLAAGKGPSLVNCMAGKDRTGWAVALVHSIAGVHRDDILYDYLLTNTAGNPEARMASRMAAISAMTGESDPEVIRVFLSVEPEYLDTAYATITEQCGTLENYLETVLACSAAVRENLAAAITE